MKLCFIGNSGSGKTTLAERIALSLEEPMHYANVKDLPTPLQEDNFSQVINKQEAIRDKILGNIATHESGCFDRSVFDQYCYSNRFLGDCLSKLNTDKLQGENYLHMLKRALAHLKWSRILLKREVTHIERYFYCEPLADYIKKQQIMFEYEEKAKKRFGDLLLQEIYVTMLKILPKDKLVIVPAMGLEERVDFVLEALK